LLDSEPAWKKRRREGAKGEKKTKLWVVLSLVGGVLVLAFMIFMMVRPLTEKPEKVKEKPSEGRAVVVKKIVENKDGKTHRYVEFSRGKALIRWDTDESNFNTLKEGQEVLLEYKASPLTGDPLKVYGWHPWVVAKPDGDSSSKK
jgi:flagellar biosynthesis/type III secretory pathway M-ring protein FliF/YscJ